MTADTLHQPRTSGAELVRAIEEACDRFASKPISEATLGEDHARALVAASVWWHEIRESLLRLDGAVKDSERLDEIERTKCYPFWNGGVDGWIFIVAQERSSKIDRRGTGPTVREAIDNARVL